MFIVAALVKGVSKFNGIKDEVEAEGDDEELPKKEVTEYRGVSARLNFLAQTKLLLEFFFKYCLVIVF